MIKDNEREQMKTNLEYWNESVELHALSPFYRMHDFKAGKVVLNDLELGEVGDVSGKSLLHLQCHFGMDTLSWARLGASVTGMDYSEIAIKKARELAKDVNIDARFIHCNLYDLPKNLEGQFDIVYTSYGVLTWLPDIVEWARIAASYVKPGGFFYIAEFHPFAAVFDAEADALQYRDPYFARDAISYDDAADYADGTAVLKNTTDFEWLHPMGEIVSSLIEAGLVLEFLHEHAFTVFRQLPFLVVDKPGIWRFAQEPAPIPLMFSLRAKKPEVIP